MIVRLAVPRVCDGVARTAWEDFTRRDMVVY